MLKRDAVKQADADSVPKWFMTYSDVITLLMTFFILLLTFSNNEPERFELMKQALFGAGGSSGTIGAKSEAVDLDSIVVRRRPNASRLTIRGSETPPTYTDLVMESVGEGLRSLEKQNEFAHVETITIDIPFDLFFNGQGELTEIAQRHIAMLAAQMKRLPLELETVVANINDLEEATHLATAMTNEFHIPAGRVGVGVAAASSRAPLGLRLIVSHHHEQSEET